MRRTTPGLIAALALIGGAIYSQRPPKQIVGPDGGGFLLNSGWRIQPVGRSIPLSTLPMSHSLAPDGRVLAVLNGGFAKPSISLLDLETLRESARVEIGDGWRGLAFSADGSKLWVGNGARGVVTEYGVDGAKLTLRKKIDLYTGEAQGAAHLIADIMPWKDRLLVVDQEQDKVLIVDPVASTVSTGFSVARNPYAILLSPDGASAFVSSWSTAQVVEYRLPDGVELSRVAVGAHPTEMLWLPAPRPRAGRDSDDEDERPGVALPRMAVACANTNSVYVLQKDGPTWRVKERVNIALTPRQPVGMTPSSLSLSPDRQRMYVACSDANAVAVADVTGTSTKVLGFVPTGWYPTAVRALRGGRLVVLNGKGMGSHANPYDPARRRTPGQRSEYVAAIQQGSALVIDNIDGIQLAAYTRTVLENSPYRDSLLEKAGIEKGNPVPQTPGGDTPIKHVILIMKENRTYDQVLGDMKEGNGDPDLVLFGESVTPNHHKLAREFVLLDNFYVNADVSADGYYWTTAAIEPDSDQKTWPMEYGGRVYSPHGGPNMFSVMPNTPEGIRQAPGGFLWDKAAEAGVSFYNYGFSAINLPDPPETGVQIQDVRDPVLKPHTSYDFRQHDRSFSDVKRIQVFLRDLAAWEKKGDMPRLVVMSIGNDHTQGTRPGRCTPASCVADNDQAIGVAVEGVTKSKFWSSTAVFILEDDAQDGPDHVDSHRSPAFVISPYTRRGVVDSTLYNTTSVLRTIELILGLKPMTMFDAAARPMANAFQRASNLSPYHNEPPRVALNEKNPARSATAGRSEKLDFSASDRADEHELNDILWLAIRGTTPPAPVHSRFGW